jgi:hypothetical protein
MPTLGAKDAPKMGHLGHPDFWAGLDMATGHGPESFISIGHFVQRISEK